MDQNNTTSVTGDREAQPQLTTANSRRGSWNAFPFILGTAAGLTLAGGWLTNLIVFLIYQFNIKSIDAAQINNVVNGSATLIPVIAAIVADSFFGCFSVIWISSIIYLLGLILLILTVTLDSLRPKKCENVTDSCVAPSNYQYAILYTCLAMTTIGMGGTRFTVVTMGANQFNNPKHQNTYFNWSFFTSYFAGVITSTGFVYVEDNVSWAWGIGICIISNVVGLAIFLIGGRYYYYDKPQGSPFTNLARVVVASVRKRKAVISSEIGDYYYGDVGDKAAMVEVEAPTKSLRSLNRAALKTEGDIQQNGLIAKPWKICSVQQVEDLKNLIKILPLWSTSIILGTPIGIQASLSVLQSLTMDRHMGPRFQIPAASILVFTLISTSVCLGLFDYLLWPMCKKLTGQNLTPLHRIGIGHVFNVASMAVSALVESKRRGIAQSHRVQGAEVVPVSVFWLVPQLAIVGIAEAFHFPGQVALYYQEFPNSLKSMSTAMISLLIAIAFYLSTALVDFVRRVTNWLPNNINDGRVDNVYWLVVILGILNFGYYLLCSWKYKYKYVLKEEGGASKACFL